MFQRNQFPARSVNNLTLFVNVLNLFNGLHLNANSSFITSNIVRIVLVIRILKRALALKIVSFAMAVITRYCISVSRRYRRLTLFNRMHNLNQIIQQLNPIRQ